MDEHIEIPDSSDSHIAIVGASCRFPGAADLESYWRNLVNGIESIAFLSPEEVEPSPIDPADVNNPNYVRAAATLDGVEWFDAGLFGYTAAEARVMDPQQRIFLECAWQTLEHAGYNPEAFEGRIGVFGGARTNSYLFNVYNNPEIAASIGAFEIGLGNDLAFLTARVSHRLNLRGPSCAVHTACSTGLVAVHLACQSLFLRECDMALAGAVSIQIPQRTGYYYRQDGILSPDGHCRVFDAGARGTVFGSGVGIVLLKRAAEAIADKDTIYAVIRGSATNNDGAQKASFTSPSVSGQTDVILDAMAFAGVEPESISYIEAHGTGTRIGDPIELRALTEAFRNATGKRGFCSIGSVKSNFGHLDAAAGMAGLIKVMLAMNHRTLPPTLHFQAPNPQIDFEESPFRVNVEPMPWEPCCGIRRAGLSAFGVGGTNVHVILEEPPEKPAKISDSGWQILLISARSPEALERSAAAFGDFFENGAAISVADAAFTAQIGRKAFEHRRAVICRSGMDAMQRLRAPQDALVVTGRAARAQRPVTFLFPGQGTQYAGMGRELYDQFRSYRLAIDCCAAALQPHLGFDIRDLLSSPDPEDARLQLRQTAVTQPLLFAVEYALAQLLIDLGLRPECMLGHSVGEYVAACCAGIFSLDDALRIVSARGRLMQSMPAGAMLAVGASETGVKQMLPAELALAAVNGEAQCVVSGPVEQIEAFASSCSAAGLACARLETSHAFHSAMMDPILKPFESEFSAVALQPPGIPVIASLSGRYIEAAEATDPSYWSAQLRHTTRFGTAVDTLARQDGRMLVEVGPGRVLSGLCISSKKFDAESVVPVLERPHAGRPETSQFLLGLGRLWVAGAEIEWRKLHDGPRQRIAVPLSPMERQRFWLEASGQSQPVAPASKSGKNPNVDAWFHCPVWKFAPLTTVDAPPKRWLVIGDDSRQQRSVADELTHAGHAVIQASFSAEFGKRGEREWSLKGSEDFASLVRQLKAEDLMPQRVAYFVPPVRSGEDVFADAQRLGYFALLRLAQTLASVRPDSPVGVVAITCGAEALGMEVLCPELATIAGLLKVIPQESDRLTCRTIDLATEEWRQGDAGLAALLAADLVHGVEHSIALRRAARWKKAFEPARVPAGAAVVRPLRERGVYMITGGLGGVGLITARYLAHKHRARLALVGRSALSAQEIGPANGSRVLNRAQAIAEMEAAGSQVLTLAADVAAPGQVQAAIAETEARFGAIHGIIHAAGITAGPSIYRPFAEISELEAYAQFKPKALGCYAIEKALGGRELDFLALFSSSSAVLGGLGYAAYAAANSFLDAFAVSRSRSGMPCISIDWDPWPPETRHYAQASTRIERYAMTEAEAGEALRRAVSLGPAGQVAIITGDFAQRQGLWLNESVPVASPSGVSPSRERSTEYQAPRSELERTIAGMWQSMLGLEQIGINDNFFEIGGHSLLATRLVSNLRDQLGAEIEIRRFFEEPTVASLADWIQNAPASADRERAEILAALDELSDQEVEEQLKRYSAAQSA